MRLRLKISPVAPACRAPVRRHLGAGGFTLIELMVVVGVIVLLVGGIGFALRDTAGGSLANAQNILATLAGQARAQAAVNQTEARVLIYAVRPPGGDADKYLRLLQVFIASPQGSTTWQPVGAPVYLPRGIYIVPASTAGLLDGIAWPANPAPVSTLGIGTNPNQPNGSAFFGASTVFYVGFRADGSLDPAPNPYLKLVVTTGSLKNNLPAFAQANAVRGVLIRPSGAVTFVNRAEEF